MRGTVAYDCCSMQGDWTLLFAGEGFLGIMAAHLCQAGGPSHGMRNEISSSKEGRKGRQ
jgi:hypothetical protein